MRSKHELDSLDGMILPGGESTAMRVIGQGSGDREESVLHKLRELSASGKPIWGTCAGCILLSDHVSSNLGGGTNDCKTSLAAVKASSLYGDCHIGGIDIDTCRNFFGRQTKSFETVCSSSDAHFDRFPCVFIRAPAIVSIGAKATPLASINHEGEVITVAAKQGNLLATCFHPELTNDLRIHKYFINMVRNQSIES